MSSDNWRTEIKEGYWNLVVRYKGLYDTGNIHVTINDKDYMFKAYRADYSDVRVADIVKRLLDGEELHGYDNRSPSKRALNFLEDQCGAGIPGEPPPESRKVK